VPSTIIHKSALNNNTQKTLKINKKLCIQPFGRAISKSLIEVVDYLYNKLQSFLNHVSVLDLMEIPPLYNSVRRQYNSYDIIKAIKSRCDINIGILEEDIYSPGFNFVFGLAEIEDEKAVGGRAVVSIHRLKPEFYGFNADKDLLKIRTLKEVMHETGHILGLNHCPDSKCVMHFSNSIIDTDIKNWMYCPKCLKKLIS